MAFTSFSLDVIDAIENINHPDDWYFYFPGGSFVWSEASGELRFYYQGELFKINTVAEVKQFKEWLLQQKALEKQPKAG